MTTPHPNGRPGQEWARILAWSISQILLFLACSAAYKLVRKTFIIQAESVAFDHALQILDIQGALSTNSELDLQRWVLDRGDLIPLFNYIYAYYMYGFTPVRFSCWCLPRLVTATYGESSFCP